MTTRPMNGTKTHPLTKSSLSALSDLARRPDARQNLNPGVSNRLLREDLVESVQLPSPFTSHKGKLIEHLQITEAGRVVLRERGLLKA